MVEKEKRNGINKGEVFSWLIVLAVLAPFLIYALPSLIGAEDALIVKSGSMEPRIPTGSVIVIYDTPVSTLTEGDIITFVGGENPRTGEREYTTHRIIGVQNNGADPIFKTKGDNNEDPDPGTVSADRVVGEHAFTIPYLGYLLVWLRGQNAFVLLVLLPAALLVLNELREIMSEVSYLKQEGNDLELVGTASLSIAGIIGLTAAGFYTGAVPSLLQKFGLQLAFTPTVFGFMIMASMLVSMAVLKFI